MDFSITAGYGNGATLTIAGTIDVAESSDAGISIAVAFAEDTARTDQRWWTRPCHARLTLARSYDLPAGSAPLVTILAESAGASHPVRARATLGDTHVAQRTADAAGRSHEQLILRFDDEAAIEDAADAPVAPAEQQEPCLDTAEPLDADETPDAPRDAPVNGESAPATVPPSGESITSTPTYTVVLGSLAGDAPATIQTIPVVPADGETPPVG